MALAVVSGDITLNSMRVFVHEAVPQCEDRSGVQCLIVDDSGNLVYEEDLINFDGRASFLGRDNNRLRVIVPTLTDLVTKRQCTELFNVQLNSRRFYTVRTWPHPLATPPNCLHMPALCGPSSIVS